MGTRREYIQTTQITKAQLEAMMDNNINIRDNMMKFPNEEAAVSILQQIMSALTLIGFVPGVGTTASAILTFTSEMIHMFEDLAADELRTIETSLTDGFYGLYGVHNQMDSNPNWQAVEITYGVLHFVDEGVLTVSSRNISIDRVKINGSWVS